MQLLLSHSFRQTPNFDRSFKLKTISNANIWDIIDEQCSLSIKYIVYIILKYIWKNDPNHDQLLIKHLTKKETQFGSDIFIECVELLFEIHLKLLALNYLARDLSFFYCCCVFGVENISPESKFGEKNIQNIFRFFFEWNFWQIFLDCLIFLKELCSKTNFRTKHLKSLFWQLPTIKINFTLTLFTIQSQSHENNSNLHFAAFIRNTHRIFQMLGSSRNSRKGGGGGIRSVKQARVPFLPLFPLQTHTQNNSRSTDSCTRSIRFSSFCCEHVPKENGPSKQMFVDSFRPNFRFLNSNRTTTTGSAFALQMAK